MTISICLNEVFFSLGENIYSYTKNIFCNLSLKKNYTRLETNVHNEK